MSLSEGEIRILQSSGTSPDATLRRRAVAIVLAKRGSSEVVARDLIGASFVAATQPSFHLIPRGSSMAGEEQFIRDFDILSEATAGFSDTSPESLEACLTENPPSLAPLRMIVGFTHNELAVAMKLQNPESTSAGSTLKTFERKPIPERVTDRRSSMIRTIAQTIDGLMRGQLLTVPDAVSSSFRSKLDKRDTREGWTSVQEQTDGVPYSALLYQRYVGGVWRQVQDAYSEVKGDKLLEDPIENLLRDAGVEFHRSQTGASGAAQTAELYGISPGPDFVLPPESPTAVIESKVGEDGGTVRDKAARIRTLATAAHDRGLIACAVIDGKGWSERVNALVDVVIATEGRTYTLQTLPHLLEVPAISDLRSSES